MQQIEDLVSQSLSLPNPRISKIQPLSGQELHIQNCHFCKQSILEKNFLKIENSETFFHANHLLCYNCDSDITHKIFFEEESQFYCESCFQKKYLPICENCRLPITGDFSLTDNQHYHKKCFLCSNCGFVLRDNYLHNQGQNYCLSCSDTLADTCSKCGLKILDEKFETEDERCFHVKCFFCGICNQKLDERSFIPFKNDGYHVDCFRDNLAFKCDNCNELIQGQYYQDQERRLHLRCIEEI